MKSTTLFLSFLFISLAYAFPSFVQIPNRPNRPRTLGQTQNSARALPAPLAPRHIDVSGKHAWVPPSDGDLRGPCPGMNALANHNYISHSGFVTVDEATTMPNLVWGFGADMDTLAIVLAEVYGSGDGVHISIGGPVPRWEEPAAVFDGQGLDGTHNQFESDSSPTRGDYYPLHGNNYDVQESYFRSLLALNNNSNGLIAADRILEYRIERYDHSVATNPYFFFGPVAMVISTLVYLFITGVLANFGDPAQPKGYLSDEDLKSLFGFTTDASGELRYTPGHERIPTNWYRRPDDFTHAQAAPQIVALGKAAPRTLTPGGNMGRPNSFVPMNMAELTGGVYTDETLFQGNNSLCFCFQALQLAMPAMAVGAAAFLAGDATSALDEWMCPELHKLNEEMYNRYPGYKKRG